MSAPSVDQQHASSPEAAPNAEATTAATPETAPAAMLTEETTPAMAAPQGVEAPAAATPAPEPVEEEDPMAVAFANVPAQIGRSGSRDAMDFEASLAEPSEGDIVSGVIVHRDRDGALLVDIGAKSEGLVRPNEVSRGNNAAASVLGGEPVSEELKVGDTIRVVVIGRDKEDGKLLLSKKRADFERAWDRVEEALADKRVINAMVTERVKGGLVVDLGIRGFVPASHVGTGDFKHTNLDKYVGQSIPLKVIEVDREKHKVILSNKEATIEERASRRAQTLASLKEGEVRDGIVRRVTDYGAFVDLGGIDGLLHVSEMSWARINHPSDVVKVGDKIQVMILKMRPDQDRISLGLRQILPDPWTTVGDKYHVGDRLQVTVSRVVPFGAFVTLEGGIEAIIPNPELSTRRVSKPQDVINPGDQAEAQIIELRPDERKMTLSLRRVQEADGGGGGGRSSDAAAREEEYQQFRSQTAGNNYGDRYERATRESAGGGGGREKRRRESNDYGGGGGMGSGGGANVSTGSSARVTLRDILGEQLDRARKEVTSDSSAEASADESGASPESNGGETAE